MDQVGKEVETIALLSILLIMIKHGRKCTNLLIKVMIVQIVVIVMQDNSLLEKV